MQMWLQCSLYHSTNFRKYPMMEQVLASYAVIFYIFKMIINFWLKLFGYKSKSYMLLHIAVSSFAVFAIHNHAGLFPFFICIKYKYQTVVTEPFCISCQTYLMLIIFSTFHFHILYVINSRVMWIWRLLPMNPTQNNSEWKKMALWLQTMAVWYY